MSKLGESKMGRPLSKKYFKNGAGDQLAIRAKIGSNAEGNGFIVKQTGESRYMVTVGSNTGVVYLVDKANGTLAAGEATITFQNASASTKRVKKLLAHRVIFFDGTSASWSFNPASGDIWEAADVEDGFEPLPATITIGTPPASFSATAPAGHTFTVSATRSPAVGTLAYQWQVDTGSGFANVTNAGVYSGATTASLAISDSTGLDGNDYRVIVSLTGVTATPVTSSVATLTVA